MSKMSRGQWSQYSTLAAQLWTLNLLFCKSRSSQHWSLANTLLSVISVVMLLTLKIDFVAVTKQEAYSLCASIAQFWSVLFLANKRYFCGRGLRRRWTDLILRILNGFATLRFHIGALLRHLFVWLAFLGLENRVVDCHSDFWLLKTRLCPHLFHQIL